MDQCPVCKIEMIYILEFVLGHKARRRFYRCETCLYEKEITSK